MELICLDSQVLIWGIKEQATGGQEDMISLTKNYINSLDNNSLILIPSIVMAEFLIPIPSHLHAMVINLFTNKFIISPFDALAASKFSTIWQHHMPSGEKKIKEQPSVTRSELRADGMIVATAVAQKADRIVSHDQWIKKFAKDFIEVVDVPFIPQQTKAFDKNSKGQDWGKLPPKMNEKP